MSLAPRRVVLAELTPAAWSRLVHRSPVPDLEVRRAAAAIVAEVRDGGDAALRRANASHGGGLGDGRLRIDAAELEAAAASLPTEVAAALRRAAENITACHRPQRPVDTTLTVAPGVTVSRRWSPLPRVGVYVPGGRAPYPSSLLMGVIPARIAGVPEIVVVAPARPDGTVDPLILGAAGMLEIEEFYATGGAQAIGALAYGTSTIRPVAKIVGPGGPWVTAAKLAVYGACDIDLPAGPSEAIIVVDDTADPTVAAADLVCQAEHGPDSPVALVTTGEDLADTVLRIADGLVTGLAREAIIRASILDFGLVVIAPDHATALRFVDAWAPEHLTLHTADPRADAELVHAAGSVFLGHWTPESAGDYATGANHVLPTGGLARAAGPLSVEDFGSWRQVQELTEEGLVGLAPTIRALAHAEGLTAHARCVDVRLGTR